MITGHIILYIIILSFVTCFCTLTYHFIILFCVCILPGQWRHSALDVWPFVIRILAIHKKRHFHMTMKACFMKQIQKALIIASNQWICIHFLPNESRNIYQHQRISFLDLIVTCLYTPSCRAFEDL